MKTELIYKYIVFVTEQIPKLEKAAYIQLVLYVSSLNLINRIYIFSVCYNYKVIAGRFSN